MTNTRKKKYASGEGAQFMTRKAALKKLQVSLKHFRKLCILKGIYPREPRNRKRAQKGQTGIKTLYHVKDIQFLMHEPIIWKLRDYNIFARKVGRARALKDFKSMKRYLNNHPTLKLDHIVKERYPTFVDALRDLDDCLTLCFLFSTFPSLKHIPRDQSKLCRRLTVEFMHAVIEAKALRKVFISIKGYYYQAEIKGVSVNWIIPHHFAFTPQAKEEVDFRIMSTFVDFYTVMLGFVNFRLYHDLNIHYPPSFHGISSASETDLVDEEVYVAERVSALNLPLAKSSQENTDDDDIEIDTFPTDGDPEKLEEAKNEQLKIKKLKTLFKDLKFFINREVPREPLVFIIRCFGGEVSWDKSLFVGSTFDETDETITHQIVDRRDIDKQYISRYYVQPQWIFDSVNARSLLPENKYFMGAILPPHLSPFVDEIRTDHYIPPEERVLKDPSLIQNDDAKDEENESDEESEILSEVDDEENDSGAEIEDKSNECEEQKESEESSKNAPVDKHVSKKNKKSNTITPVETQNAQDLMKQTVSKEKQKNKKKIGRKGDNAIETTELKIREKPKTEAEREKIRQEMLNKMKVKGGEVFKEIPWEKEKIAKQEYRLREKMIEKKHRNLYKSMMEGRKKRAKEIWLLRKKRRLIEEKEKGVKKNTKAVKKSTKSS